ncbi:MAG TPA: integrin alpha [Planctomycetota bacterium]|nr:integrin alpha [Planctomycetota bacterium]
MSIAALCGLGLLLASAALPASLLSYTRYRLFELALSADVVVSGEIIDVDVDTFDLRVDQAIVQALPAPTVQVKRFKNWTCASRWTDYAAGQRVLLFLEKPQEAGKSYSILGAGDEGEMPRIGSDVLVHGYRVRACKHASYPVDSESVRGTLIPFEEFRAAILGIRAQLELTTTRDPRGEETDRVVPRGPNASLEAFAETSRTARHMCGEARSSASWAGELPAADVQLDSQALRSIHADSSRTAITEHELLDAGFVTFFGDRNGDGTDAVAVLKRHATGGPELSILRLDSEGAVVSRTLIHAEEDGSPSQLPNFAENAESLASLGDLDGDGMPELGIGAPVAQGHCGAVWILFLRRDGALRKCVELASMSALVAAGVQKDVGLGESLAPLGDLDGDGTTELAIGMGPEFRYSLSHERSIFIASIGKDGFVPRARRIDGDAEGFGESGNWLGESLASLGDVNGDGVADLAIGISDDTDGGEVRGAVWIAFLAPDGSVREKHKVSEWEGGFTGVLRDWSRFGMSLAGPGDVDGDGVPDLLVGATREVWTLLLRKDGSVKSHRRFGIEFKAGTERSPFSAQISVQRAQKPELPIHVMCGRTTKSPLGEFWLLTLDQSGALRAR